MKNCNLLLCLSVFMCWIVVAEEAVNKKKMLFWDHTQPLEKRLDDLVSRMTIKEKVNHVSASSDAMPHLGIPAYVHWNHSAHGINGSLMYPNSLSIVYPTPINQSATFNPDLMEKMGKAIGEEGRAKFHTKPKMIGGLSFWNPTVNMGRDPRWGRTNEAYGEDPYLAGKISAAYCRGMKGDHPKYFLAIATPKHFVANNDETTRFFGDSQVSMRALREYYLRPFKECIVEAKAYSIMSAYNKLNGVPCVANSWLLKDLLRGEWGFKGYAVSDASAVIFMYSKMEYVNSPEEAAAEAMKNGTDMSIGGRFGCLENLFKDPNQTLLKEETLDQAVKNQFRSRFLLGEFDPPELVPYTKISKDVISCEEHRSISKQIARESIILLQNKNNVLPLNPEKVKVLLVTGPNRDSDNYGSYSNQRKNTIDPLRPLEGLRKFYGEKMEIKVELGCSIPGNRGHGNEGLSEPIDDEYATYNGKPGWQGEYFTNDKFEGEPALVRMDKAIAFNWKKGSPDPKIPKDHFSVRWKGIVVPKTSKAFKLKLKTDDGVRLTMDGQVLLDNLRGTFNGSTDNHMNAGQKYEVMVEYVEKGGEAKARFAWDFMSPRKVAAEKAREKERIAKDKRDIIKAAEKAKESDVAIVFIGSNGTIESEGQDRKNIKLPGLQNELVEAVCAANPNTVVVLVNGSCMDLRRVKKVAPAILETFFIGPDMGESLCDVLFGKVNPSGKLPLTFYESDKQIPPMDNYDLINNERTYLYFDGPVCYPFGHGLSYTPFKYGKLKHDSKVREEKELKVSFTIQNAGERPGAEVAQLYVHDKKASVKRPRKELVAFKKVFLKPGETQKVTLLVKHKQLAFWDEPNKKWKVEPGVFDLMVGSSSEDIRLSGTFEAR